MTDGPPFLGSHCHALFSHVPPTGDASTTPVGAERRAHPAVSPRTPSPSFTYQSKNVINTQLRAEA